MTADTSAENVERVAVWLRMSGALTLETSGNHLAAETMTEAAALLRAQAERIRLLEGAKADFFWDANDREYSYPDPKEILSNYSPGEVVAVEHGAFLRTTYEAFLPEADDSMDGEWRVSANTAEEAQAAVDAERLRRDALEATNG